MLNDYAETKRRRDLTPNPSPKARGTLKVWGTLRARGGNSKRRGIAVADVSADIFFLDKREPIWAVSDTDCLLVVRTLCMLSTVRRIRDDRCAESCPYIQCSCRS